MLTKFWFFFLLMILEKSFLSKTTSIVYIFELYANQIENRYKNGCVIRFLFRLLSWKTDFIIIIFTTLGLHSIYFFPPNVSITILWIESVEFANFLSLSLEIAEKINFFCVYICNRDYFLLMRQVWEMSYELFFFFWIVLWILFNPCILIYL